MKASETKYMFDKFLKDKKVGSFYSDEDIAKIKAINYEKGYKDCVTKYNITQEHDKEYCKCKVCRQQRKQWRNK